MASFTDKAIQLAKTGARAALGVVAPGSELLSRGISAATAGQSAKEMAQSTARSYAGAAEGIQQVGAKVAEKLTGQKFDVQTLTPTGKVQQAIFGTDKPITARSVGEEMPLVKKGGKLAPIIGTVMGTLDLLPGGSGGKAFIARSLQNIDKADDVVRFLKESTKFGDDVIEKLAPVIARTKDPRVITQLLDAEVMKNGSSVSSRVADPLLTEARKYKSAEEFVKAQPTDGLSKLREVAQNSSDYKDFGNKIGAYIDYQGGKIEKFRAIYRNALGIKGDIKRGYQFPKLTEVEPEILKGALGFDSANVIPKELTVYRGIDPRTPTSRGIIAGDYVTLSKDSALHYGGQLQELKVKPEDLRYIRGNKMNGGDEFILIPKGTKVQKYPFDSELPSLEQFYNDSIKTKSQLTDIWKKAQEIDIPRSGSKERGFTTSVKEQFPKIADKVAGQYIPRDTDTLAMQARSLVRFNPEEATRIALTDKSDRGVATASELIKYYTEQSAKATDEAAKIAFDDKAAYIANESTRDLTEFGRAVQAASIIGRLGPEGQVRWAAREIQRYNEQLAKRGSVFGIRKQIPELTGEEMRLIVDEMTAIQGMDDGVEKIARFRELQKRMVERIPVPTFKKAMAVWKAGLLTGLKTSGLNIFSNLTHGVGEIVKDAPTALIDTGISLFTNKRAAGMTFRGTATGAKEGMQKGWQYLKTGFDERNIAEKLDQHAVNFGKGPFGKALQKYTDGVFRLIGAEDQPFYYGALRRSLQGQAEIAAKNAGLKGTEAKAFVNNLLQKPTEEMLKYATLDATTAVFQQDTVIGTLASKMQKASYRDVNPAEIVIPFAKTPSAVAMQVLNYSPVGAVSTILKQVISGKFDQRLLSQGLGRAVTGTAVMWLGKELFDQGRISLSTPKTEGEKKLWEAEGRQANSIKIGDSWRSLQVLGPFASSLIFGASLAKNLKETGSITKAVATAAGGALKSFTESTFLQGVKNFVDAAGDPEGYLQGYLNNLTASLVPTIVSDVARATDPLERRREGLADAVMSRIPGARRTLEPQVTTLGEDRPRAGNPLETMLDPTRPSEIRETPVTLELRRLSDSGFPAAPTQLGDKKGFEVLSPEQNTNLWRRAGEITNDKLEALFRSPEYKDLDDEEKKTVVERFTKYAGNVARAEIVLELTQDLGGNQLKEKLKELKDAGIYTEPVYKIYKEIR